MLIKMFKSKIHRATITGANVDYEGSVKIDSDLLDLAQIKPFQEVHLWNVSNGNRLTTYALPGERGSGVIETNGACCHLCGKGDIVIIATFCEVDEFQVAGWKPLVVLVNEKNKITKREWSSGGLL